LLEMCVTRSLRFSRFSALIQRSVRLVYPVPDKAWLLVYVPN
jgi:hypothetical protein